MVIEAAWCGGRGNRFAIACATAESSTAAMSCQRTSISHARTHSPLWVAWSRMESAASSVTGELPCNTLCSASIDQSNHRTTVSTCHQRLLSCLPACLYACIQTCSHHAGCHGRLPPLRRRGGPALCRAGEVGLVNTRLRSGQHRLNACSDRDTDEMDSEEEAIVYGQIYHTFSEGCRD